MQTVLLALLVLVLSVGALALGLFFGRAPIKGSCGGIACGNACGSCERRAAR
ncbi:hypothetical protein LUX29_04410 [Aureimonas altamirensis]|uniref:hypothetical protein n=1 Tax=Aureimonas altamirensis TaxID=370622 RepID=UPI001E5D21AE|nr:hypothetical protein [Aureimonas altamirensis]UHD46467.1 hypothetical protein LUX29_04410 [Aureimonas altamirensis]